MPKAKNVSAKTRATRKASVKMPKKRINKLQAEQDAKKAELEKCREEDVQKGKKSELLKKPRTLSTEKAEAMLQNK